MVSLSFLPRLLFAFQASFFGTALASGGETLCQFGSGPGRDRDGGFVRGNTSSTNGEWTVEDKSLPFTNRFAGEGYERHNYPEAAAVVDLRERGHQPVVDFREIRNEPRANRPQEFDRDPIMFTGRWEHGGQEHFYRVTVRQVSHSFGPLPTVVYFRNLPVPRIGTDSDERIIADLLDDGNVVIELDCSGLPTEEPEPQQALSAFNNGLIDRVVRLTKAVITPDENFLYWVPEGHRLARNVPFWNIERHGAHGSMERIVEVFNRDITRRAGADPIDSPDQLHGPNGEALDYNLYLDLVYPSGTPDQRVPVIAHFATQCRMARGFREHRVAYPITWVTSGYALAYVDHVYNPLARARYYGYFDAYSLQTWNGVAAGSAAIRHLRAHADRYNLSGRVGALGHSKSSYTVMRLADPNHPEQPEHSTFVGFPPGSPEPQPWAGQSSRVEVAYVSMGLGVRWTQYTTPDVVPLIVAVGRHDNFNYWNVTPAQVAKAEDLDLNHLAIWMAELGHSYPLGRDHATGINRTHLVRRFFDQHLYPHDDDKLAVLAVTPPDGAVGVPGDGSIPVFGVEEENQLPDNLRGLPVRQPVTVRFARPVEPDSLLSGRLRLRVAETGETVEGTWKASLGNTRFTFAPVEPLAPETAYAVEIEAGVRDTEGRALPRSHRQVFTTGG